MTFLYVFQFTLLCSFIHLQSSSFISPVSIQGYHSFSILFCHKLIVGSWDNYNSLYMKCKHLSSYHTHIQVEWNVSASFQGVGCLSDNNNNWKIYWEPPAARTTDHVLCLFMCFGFCCCCCCCRFFLLWSFKVYLTQSGVCVVYTNWI